MQLKASAPGSLMLLGEYAVLHGHPALLCAVDKRLYVHLKPRNDNQVFLFSDRYDLYTTSIDALSRVEPYGFVLETLQQFRRHLPSGCDLHIHSEFSDQIGFGSSAALVAATLAVINEWLQLKLTLLQLVDYGAQIIRIVQEGRGSGADVAASIYGGMVAYQMTPLSVQSFAITHPLVACYAGFKTKTSIAIKQINESFRTSPHLLNAIFEAIGECAKVGIESLHHANWQVLGRMFSIQQGLMSALGVNLPILQRLVECLEVRDTILGAKISGAGLGDCIVGLGSANTSCIIGIDGACYIPVNMSKKGVICERH